MNGVVFTYLLFTLSPFHPSALPPFHLLLFRYSAIPLAPVTFCGGADVYTYDREDRSTQEEFKPVKSTWIVAACALLLLGSTMEADAQRRTRTRTRSTRVVRKTTAKASGAETSLVGIRLFDTGVRVVSVYGTPDDIQPVNIGGGAVGGGPGGGFSGGGARGGGGGGGSTTFQGSGGGNGGPGSGNPVSQVHVPDSSEFGFGNDALRQTAVSPGTTSTTGSGPTGPSRGGGLTPSGGDGGGRSAGSGGGADAGSAERVSMTRWIYNRGGSKYGFVLDKFNRVIQIEAIGLQNAKVRTRAGIGFGATFARIMKTYGAPDGYEIAGNTIVVRYLTRKRVAFRLNRLGENKPHVVTGVVVAAGK